MLKDDKSAGPDGIHPAVLKFCAPVLAVHLAILFNALLASGIFPSSLKQSFVVPIFKKGDRSMINNYRPIVIQSSLAKVFEDLVLDHLYFYLKRFVSDRQHGFLRGRSTASNLLTFQDYVMSAFLDSCQVDCIYLDFAKAFDRVHHGLLIAKLAGYGIGGKLLRWLDSYLRDRVLFVKSDGVLSSPFPVLSGVPQGSHLGPIMFIIFINDLIDLLLVNGLMFADDLKIFARILSIQDHRALQQSLFNIVEWCKRNGMELNISKCNVISFTRKPSTLTFDYRVGNVTLNRINLIRDLGVIFTPTLSPLEHILSITSRAYSILGFIYRSTRNFKSPLSLIALYKSLVLPILDYNSVIWTPFQLGHIDLLNKVQVRFLRLTGIRLGFQYLDTPIAELEQHLRLLPLALRRKMFDLLFIYKLVNGLLDCADLLMQIDLCVPRGTRSRAIFGRRFRPTNYSYNNGLARMVRVGSLAAGSVDFFADPLSTFKIKVIQMLQEEIIV